MLEIQATEDVSLMRFVENINLPDYASKDKNGQRKVVLEKSVIRYRYGWKSINADKDGG